MLPPIGGSVYLRGTVHVFLRVHTIPFAGIPSCFISILPEWYEMDAVTDGATEE